MRLDPAAAAAAERARSLHWWWGDEHTLCLEGWLPAADGMVVVRALDRVARRLPDDPTDDDFPADPGGAVEQRRADALVALCSARIAADPDPDRATVVVHAPLQALLGHGNAEIAGGPVIGPDVVARLACDCRLQVVSEDRAGHATGIGYTSRKVPPWLARQVTYRDKGCSFPGCHRRAFLHCHHIVPWPWGPTGLDNLVAVCHFHHKLLHEFGWRVRLTREGAVWYRPGGSVFVPGPDPPRTAVA